MDRAAVGRDRGLGDLLRQLVENDADRGRDTDRRTKEERAGDDDAVRDIVDRVTKKQETSAPIDAAVVMVMVMMVEGREEMREKIEAQEAGKHGECSILGRSRERFGDEF